MDNRRTPQETLSPAFRTELSTRRVEIRSYLDGGGSLETLAISLNHRLAGSATVTAIELKTFLSGGLLVPLVLEEIRTLFSDERKTAKADQKRQKSRGAALSFTETASVLRRIKYYCIMNADAKGYPLGVVLLCRQVFGRDDSDTSADLLIKQMTRFLNGETSFKRHIGIVSAFVDKHNVPDQPDARMVVQAFSLYFTDPDFDFETGISQKRIEIEDIAGYYVVGNDDQRSLMYIHKSGLVREMNRNLLYEGVICPLDGYTFAIVLRQTLNRRMKRVYHAHRGLFGAWLSEPEGGGIGPPNVRFFNTHVSYTSDFSGSARQLRSDLAAIDLTAELKDLPYHPTLTTEQFDRFRKEADRLKDDE